MTRAKYLTGVIVIAIVVAASMLGLGERLHTLANPIAPPQAELAQAVTSFTVDTPLGGNVELEWATTGILSDPSIKPPESELAAAPDLGSLHLALLLQNTGAGNVTGYVELETTLVFTVSHTIQTTLAGTQTTRPVGPQVTGTFQSGVLNLLSERFPYITQSGESVERQFQLTGSASPAPGVLIGEYHETIWGVGLEPITIGGTFELEDLNAILAADNQVPAANPSTVNTAVNTAVAVNLTGSDTDGDPLSYLIVTQPLHGTLSGAAPNLIYTPAAGYQGYDSFTFSVNDGKATSQPAAVTLVVGAPPLPNHVPVANARILSAFQGQATPITLTGSDADGDPLTFTIIAQPGHGTLSGTTPDLSYLSEAFYTGEDSFTFMVSDGKANSATATVTINVGNNPIDNPGGTNTPPVANAQTVSTLQGQAKVIQLTGSDSDGNSLTFTIVTQPANGTLGGNAPDVTYTSNETFVGQDSFTFKVSDGLADSATATVTINVVGATTSDEDGIIFLPGVKR